MPPYGMAAHFGSTSSRPRPRKGSPMITHTIPATLAGFGAIRAELEWDPTVPVMVSARFTVPGQEEIPWELALDLLRMGMATVAPNMCGHLDVRVTTETRGGYPSDRESVVLYLQSPEGTAVITLDYAAMVAFRDAVTLANVNEEASMLALVDQFLVTLNEEAF